LRTEIHKKREQPRSAASACHQGRMEILHLLNPLPEKRPAPCLYPQERKKPRLPPLQMVLHNVQ
jgi:hypothetical protein